MKTLREFRVTQHAPRISSVRDFISVKWQDLYAKTRGSAEGNFHAARGTVERTPTCPGAAHRYISGRQT